MNKKVSWQYYFARKFSLQRFEIVLRVFVSGFYKEHFGVRLKNVMIKPGEGGNHEIWLDKREYELVIRRIFNIVCRNLKNFYYYKRIIKQVQKDWLTAAEKVAKRVNHKLSNKELGKLYDIFVYHHQEHFNKPIWIPFIIEPLLSEVAKRALLALLKRTGRMGEYDQWFQTIFSPEEKNAITAAEEAILKVALQIKRGRWRGKNLNKVLKRLTERYGFIPCYDVVDAPWDSTHFKKELAKLIKSPIREIVEKIEDYRILFKRRRREFKKFLRTFKMTDRECELFVMAHEFVFIKDERDDYRRRGSYFGRPLFAEIGRRLGLGLREACYLTIKETKNFLHQEGESPSPDLIKERIHGYLLLRKYSRSMIVASGKEMVRILKCEIGRKEKVRIQEIKGIIGSTGKVSGLVVIVRTKNDLRLVYKGAIMVAITTSPDFVPAMRQCKAIVTDEGGITSHAAIVSREMKKPCVIGTKIATKVLKDGDLVEVDAVKGVVRKIK